MIFIPPELQIRASIKPGSVYYFQETSFSSDAPHYFIVLNCSPLADRVILLVCSSSQGDKARRRRRYLPPETLVEIEREHYAGFAMDSIVDCNTVFPKSIDELVSKLADGRLKLKTEMDTTIVEKLRQGVLASPLVDEELKDLLRSTNRPVETTGRTLMP